MGYSGRYHAASLAAVFLALAVGILIGVGFGSDIVSGTAESLEESLGSDLTDAREQIDELEADLERERNLSGRLYPAVVGSRLPGSRIAVVALGALPEEIPRAVDEAIDPTGAELTEVMAIPVPAEVDQVVDALVGSDAERLGDRDALERAGRRAGSALVRGNETFDEVRSVLLSRYSGDPGPVNDIVLFRQPPAELDEDAAEDESRLEAGLVDGMRAAGATVVGVERSDEEVSSIEAFEALDISSVDNVDALPGQVSLVLALGGASGHFGTKETADRLLPDLLPPAAGPVP